MKVAQYEVLGSEAKRHVRPVRDERNARLLVFARGSAIAGICRSSRSGTDSSLKTLTQHFVLGYFRQVPAGLIFSNHPLLRKRHRMKTGASCACKANARSAPSRRMAKTASLGLTSPSFFLRHHRYRRNSRCGAEDAWAQTAECNLPCIPGYDHPSRTNVCTGDRYST